MTTNIVFLQEAFEEAETAQLWYVERSLAAASAFINELNHAVDVVSENPERWPRYISGTRRYVFPKFPFSLIYRIHKDVIEVIAVSHDKRKPGYWSQR